MEYAEVVDTNEESKNKGEETDATEPVPDDSTRFRWNHLGFTPFTGKVLVF
jgi:hypothetical protein